MFINVEIIKSLLFLVPLTSTILVPITLFLTYYIAVNNNHVEKFLPYISECAANPPESDFFAQLFNINAVLVGATIYIYYRVIISLYQTHQKSSANSHSKLILILNNVSLPFGFALCIGTSMVANFRAVEILPVHDFGAFITFNGGLIYCAFQTVISFLMINDGYVSSRLAWTRFGITVTIIVSIISMSLFGLWSFKLFTGDDQFHWKPSDGGYVQHVISTGSEWLLVLALNSAVGSAINEIRTYCRVSAKLLKYHVISDTTEL